MQSQLINHYASASSFSTIGLRNSNELNKKEIEQRELSQSACMSCMSAAPGKGKGLIKTIIGAFKKKIKRSKK